MKKAILVTLPLLFGMVFVLVAPHCVEAAKPSDVIVVNEPTEPVPTRDVDHPARRPVQKLAVAPTGTLPGPANFVLFTVPAGKRLVVEHFSSEVGILSTASVDRYVLGIETPSKPGVSIFNHFIAPSYHSPCGTCGSGTELFVASQPIRMYVNGGDTLVVNITFSGAVGPDAFGFFAITGYLVDVP